MVMQDSQSHARAETAFMKALRNGRNDTNIFSRLAGKDNYLLTLSQLLAAVSAGPESYLGVQDISTADIIGTENRGQDFSRGFAPVKRWMKARWINVFRLLASDQLNETIKVIEVGGKYFVRDGHHRVSAARILGIDYMSAEVKKCSLPYKLPHAIDRNLLPLVAAKDQFHRSTGIFNIISDDDFFVTCPETWLWLEKEITDFNRSWFIRRFNREPNDTAEQIHIWYENFYKNVIDYIRRNSLTYLFPGQHETDIVAALIRLWNSYEYPDDIWIGEIYKIFIAQQRKRKRLRAAMQIASTWLKRWLMSAEDEYRFFVSISQIDKLADDFCPLPKERGLYRYLYKQLIHCYAPSLKQEYGRAPYLHELSLRWYKDFYKPVRTAAKNHFPDSGKQQARFYKDFSKKYLTSILRKDIGIGTALQKQGENYA